MSFDLPKRGLVFWPVGNGDSTTIIIDSDTYLQVDLNHLEKSDDDDDASWAIVDELVERLPRVNRRPYLAAFVLTHPDQDHCRGFANLLKKVDIGELWFTPRVFLEYNKDLCDDAKEFKKEAMRRVKETIENPFVSSGNRVRIIGFDNLLKKDEFKGFPKDKLSIPGQEVSEIDGEDLFSDVQFFIHSPFKDDLREDRNDTSLSFQIKLMNGRNEGNALFFGDLAYESLKKIFEATNDSNNLAWDILLAPHHCSKKVMYVRNDSGEDTFKKDIMTYFEDSQNENGHIISSSMPIKGKDQSGDNPPHTKAKNRYEEIVEGDFLCTHEHPSEETPEPIVFEVGENGFTYLGPGKQSKGNLKEGIAAARGFDSPPSERVGYGQSKIK